MTPFFPAVLLSVRKLGLRVVRSLQRAGIVALAMSAWSCSRPAKTADSIGKICDRNGIVLVEVKVARDGEKVFSFPFKAVGAHVLAALDAKVLPEPGETVYLTIDADAQVVAEKKLRSVPRGAAVLLDYDTGDILAMASVPSFDPSAYDPEKMRKDETAPWLNRAISAYAPGASFLPVTALAGLSAGLREFHHDCTGGVTYGNKFMKCWIADREGGQGGGHGSLDLAQGMKNSCSPFFYTYGVAAGIENIDRVAATLGLGSQTGIPLPREAPGVLPGPEYLKKISPQEIWSDGYTANTSIGQGMVLASPLQMAVVSAAIGNGGTVFQPRLVDRIVRADGTIERKEPVIRASLKDIGITADDVAIVRKAMQTSVEPGGNAAKGATPGYVVSARTGTAQFWRNGSKDNHTWFIGCAEAEKRHYAFAVLVQGAKSGGSVAAPIASRILQGIADAAEDKKLIPMEAAAGSFDFVAEVK